MVSVPITVVLKSITSRKPDVDLVAFLTQALMIAVQTLIVSRITASLIQFVLKEDMVEMDWKWETLLCARNLGKIATKWRDALVSVVNVVLED